jgi:hypothetical protein
LLLLFYSEPLLELVHVIIKHDHAVNDISRVAKHNIHGLNQTCGDVVPLIRHDLIKLSLLEFDPLLKGCVRCSDYTETLTVKEL